VVVLMSDDPVVKLFQAWKQVYAVTLDATFVWCKAIKAMAGRAGGAGGPVQAYIGECASASRGPGVVRIKVTAQPANTPGAKLSEVVPGQLQFRQPAQARPQPQVTDRGNQVFEVSVGALPRGGWLCELTDANGVPLGAAVVYIDDLHPTS
jgi:hypothetical protein